MSASILDGAAVGAELRAEAAAMASELRGLGVQPGLGVLLVGDDPASAVYVRNKTRACDEVGLRHETRRLPAEATTAAVEAVVEEWNARPDVHGILVQLPLPARVDAACVLDRIDPRKDVDGFHPDNVGRLVQKRPRFVPCTPAGIMELLARRGVEVRGRRAVVVGRSDIVGKPLAMLLLHADATVTLAHSKTEGLPRVTREADLLVVAAGRAGLVRGEHIRPGAVVIDVGMNRIVRAEDARELLEPARLPDFERRGQALVGDVHFPAALEVASALTPVPGGVGPLTIAMLVRNTVLAARLARGLEPLPPRGRAA
jgi:methylenetetrahydrofolate dehydrogenase (NADP+)/methenyltetrahydrofolate cyclohydrolase